jgi:serine/threonine protein kinase/tetratricopeptide (TPR) repeat protein
MGSRPVGGRYEIKRKIAEGGAASIYLATDRVNGNAVALKIPGEDDLKIYDSLVHEYRFAFTHRHPTLLRPLDLIFDSKKPVIISPYIDGQTIDRYISPIRARNDAPSFLRTLRGIFASILEAAGFIHFCGYCYNDFKPSNIMVRDHKGESGDTRISLIDFNLVSSIDDQPSRRGTLHYLAPEAILGNKVTPLSDIYSIGALFYQVLTGILPVDSHNESELIRDIIEGEDINWNCVPECFRDGLSSMLNRDPDQRPSNTVRAAEVLRVFDEYNGLRKSRSEFYLAAGPPPFALDLKDKFDMFRDSEREKIFVIRGYSYNRSSLDFLEAECRIGGMDCFRIYEKDGEKGAAIILENIGALPENDNSAKIILVENLEPLGDDNIGRLLDLVGTRNHIYAAAVASRWYKSKIKCVTFDPLKHCDGERLTEISLKAFLKGNRENIDRRSLCKSTGGDPEQIFNYLKHAAKSNGFEHGNTRTSLKLPSVDIDIPENDSIYRRMTALLNEEQRDFASLLSAWGRAVPLLMLVNIENNQQEILETLIEDDILIRKKESVVFLSGGLRNFIYEKIEETAKKEYHRFWAINAEKLIRDNDERLELTAHHWARSGDLDRAFRHNASAAEEFYKSGDYTKAPKFADLLNEFVLDDPARRIRALKINGDINAAVGYFKTARKYYVEILSGGKDNKTRAETVKKLGTLYMHSGNYKKSLHYLRRALIYYSAENDIGNISECNNSITVALWQEGDYPTALESLINSAKNGSISLSLDEDDNGEESTRDERRILNATLDIARNLKNNRMIINSYESLGRCLVNNGDFENGIAYFKKALELSERIKSKNEIIQSLTNLGNCYYTKGDLFMAIECFHNARQSAESFGNNYLRTLAELKLTDLSMTMGNYSLALRVLSAIEGDRIYNEDRLLKLKVDLRKAQLCLTLGDYNTSLHLTERIVKSAYVMGKYELAIRAQLVVSESRSYISGTDSIENYKVNFSRAKKHNLVDLVSELQLSLAKYHKEHENHSAALHYLEDICRSPACPKEVRLEAEIHRGGMNYQPDNYESATAKLEETERTAAASGYIPLAFQAARVLGILQVRRNRIDLYDESRYRAESYRKKLLSAVPNDYPAERYKRKLILTGFQESAESEMAEKKSEKNIPVTSGH